jgi:CheY-like chemotaxis protein
VVSDLTDLKTEESYTTRQQIVDAAFEAACRIAADLNHALADSLDDLARLKEDRVAADDIGRAFASSERSAVLGLKLLSLLQRRTLRSVQSDLSTLASDTSEMLRLALRDRAELDGFTAEALAATNVDAVMLEYIVLNLIAGTQEQLPGTVKIQVDSHSAWLGAEAAEALGVPTGDYVILDIVYPADATTTLLQFKLQALDPVAAAGTGEDLGLGLAARFLRQSGGHIAVVASDDGRATLKILLPRHRETAERAPSPPEAELTPEPSQAPARPSAIVLEPDTDVRRMTASLLRQLGYEVTEPENTEDAIASNDASPADLLVAECKLPGVWTGHALAERLRRTAPNLRVVLTSDTGLDPAGASLGDVALLLKPFGLDELSALVTPDDTND